MAQQPSLTQTQLQGALSDEPLPHRTEIDEELRQLLVPRHEGFDIARLDPSARPTVIGSPDLVAAVEDIFSLVPELRGAVTRIQNAPTGGMIRQVMQDQGQDFGGLYDPHERSIYVEPTKNTSPIPEFAGEVEKNLIHELAHSTGTGHGRKMSNIEGLVKMRQDLRRLHGQ